MFKTSRYLKKSKDSSKENDGLSVNETQFSVRGFREKSEFFQNSNLGKMQKV